VNPVQPPGDDGSLKFRCSEVTTEAGRPADVAEARKGLRASGSVRRAGVVRSDAPGGA
jgi:hypothetical protein